MFEEAQLYAPVTRSGDDVTVHLAADHPGAVDPDYRAPPQRASRRLDAISPNREQLIRAVFPIGRVRVKSH